MKNRKLVLVGLLVAVIIITFFIYTIIMGFALYGFDRYEETDSLHVSGAAITGWRCHICGMAGLWTNTGVPEICTRCSIITLRDAETGDLKAGIILPILILSVCVYADIYLTRKFDKIREVSSNK